MQVTRGGGFAAIESPDGRTLYYARRGESSAWSVWSMPAGGGEESPVLPRIATWGDFDVTQDGTRLHRLAAGRSPDPPPPVQRRGGEDSLARSRSGRLSASASPRTAESLLYTHVRPGIDGALTVDRFR